MKKLAIMRHANASFEASSDFERPLTEKGLSQTVESALELRSFLSPDKVLVSSARRTKMTANTVAETLSWDNSSFVYDERLYNASLSKMLYVLEELDDEVNEVLLIAHNPGVSWLASHLCPELIFGFSTGSFCVLEFDCETWEEALNGEAKLLKSFSPA